MNGVKLVGQVDAACSEAWQGVPSRAKLWFLPHATAVTTVLSKTGAEEEGVSWTEYARAISKAG